MQFLLPKSLLRFILGIIAVPFFRLVMRKFLNSKVINEELEKDLEQWFRGALMLLIATDNMELTLWSWLPAGARDTPYFMAGRLLLAIGVIEGMPDQSLFALIHPGPQKPEIKKGHVLQSLFHYLPEFLRGVICQHLNRSSPVFAILSVFHSGEFGWICYGMAISQYLLIGLVSSKDKALGVLSEVDHALARQRHDIESELRVEDASRKAAEAQLNSMDPNIESL